MTRASLGFGMGYTWGRMNRPRIRNGTDLGRFNVNYISLFRDF